ncbi:MAG: PQQ-dependent sugar dehydrogenase [Actinomycetota bacterium]
MEGRFRLILLVLAIVLALPTAGAKALTLEPVAAPGTYVDPMYVTSDPGNPDRLFVAERQGLIKLTQGGTTTTFADLTSVVNSVNDQQGIQSIAVPPDFGQTGLFYVFYTGPDGAPVAGNLHIGELQATGDTASAATLRNVITVVHDQGTGHNGGQIQFGPDGYLYMSTGDGKCCGDPLENGQNLDSLLGKILRIDPDPSGGPGYSVPSDNPFVGDDGADEIWSYGLRNPWRFSFDHDTGAMLIGDVGNANWEEVDYEPAEAGAGRGDNFGWDCREGMNDFSDAQSNANCPGQTFTDPVFEYPHSGTGCDGSITGGYVVRDVGLSDLFGRYLYSDFCLGGLRSLVPGLPFATDNRFEVGPAVTNAISFSEDSACRIYLIEYDDDVFRLQGDDPSGCPPDPPSPVTPEAAASPSATEAELKAARRRVDRGSRAKLTATARPCPGRGGDPVTLLRAGVQLATKVLDDDCSAIFKPRIRRQWKFKALVPGDTGHLSDTSNSVRIRPRS